MDASSSSGLCADVFRPGGEQGSFRGRNSHRRQYSHGLPGQTVEVDIRVDDAPLVAGAAFTVTFAPANLALTKVSNTQHFGVLANLGPSPLCCFFQPSHN